MASELRVNTLKDASGNNSVGLSTVAGGSAKSWNHINQSFVVQDSLNVSSTTDEGGNAPNTWTITLTNAMGSVSYAVSGNCDGNANRLNAVDYTSSSAYKCHLYVAHSTSSGTGNIANTIVHGDLA
jgi:hypothetical protein|tara:strand:+ start:23 stop:400 length:378 start_codon:yes stop_codon:yes gene_type:complete